MASENVKRKGTDMTSDLTFLECESEDRTKFVLHSNGRLHVFYRRSSWRTLKRNERDSGAILELSVQETLLLHDFFTAPEVQQFIAALQDADGEDTSLNNPR